MDKKNNIYIFAVACILVFILALSAYYVFWGADSQPDAVFSKDDTLTVYTQKELPESIEDIDKRTIYPIYINVITLEQLKNIPGINESTAEAIIEYRNTNGGLFTLDELIGVGEINETVVEILLKYVTPYPIIG